MICPRAAARACGRSRNPDPRSGTDAFAAVLQAPPVEEGAKGVGIMSRRRGGGALDRVLIVLAGFALAVALHGLWNGAPCLFTSDSALLIYYLLAQLPLFIGYIVAVVLLRRQEERITVDRLGECAAAGWFTPREVLMLATGPGRWQARAWAARQPRERRLAMRLSIADATRLAFARQRMLNGTADRVARADEAEIHALVQAHRAVVIG